MILSPDDWRSLTTRLELQRPESDEELQAAVGELERWGRPIWLAAALGALKSCTDAMRFKPEAIVRVLEAAEAWLACPCDRHCAALAQTSFTPTGLWTNCDDRRHLSLIAASLLAQLAGPDGRIEQLLRLVRLMNHPLIADPRWVWMPLRQAIYSLGLVERSG